jgi:hypothetical protein
MHDQEMSDFPDPLLSCDADIAGSGATELVIFHLCHGECAESDADACMQYVTSFYVKSDISYVLTKLNFQLQILSSILYLVRVRPLRRILSSLHVLVEPGLPIKKLRTEFRKCLTRLSHEKRSEDARNSIIAQEQRLRQEYST